MFPLYYSGLGKRKNNEDYFLSFYRDDILVLGIADGVGGNKAGNVASQKSLIIFKDLFSKNVNSENISEIMEESFRKTHKRINSLSAEQEELSGMATTLTIACIYKNKLYLCHVGDSRAYIIRNNGIKQLTEDDTEVNQLILEGKITKEEAINYPRKNILTNAIGINKELNIQSINFELQEKDRLILLTDGFYSAMSKIEIRDISKNNNEFSNFSHSLINLCVQRQPSDNFTFIGVEI